MKNYSFSKFTKLVVITSLFGLVVLGVSTYASHSWGNYHWGRTANPFNLKLGDNLSTAWDPYLGTTSSDWSLSSVLDTTVVPGTALRYRSSNLDCSPVSGTVQVCNKTYGQNGWLGVASIWVSGTHITQGRVKVNDTYFNTTKYNTPAWKNLVMCQEVGHTFGLDHQDENFYNPPLGTCMDYSSDPTPNQHPNQHDYDQLELMYTHLDGTTTVGQTVSSGPGKSSVSHGADGQEVAEWGRSIRTSSDGKTSLFERDLGNGHKVFTFVIWAN